MVQIQGYASERFISQTLIQPPKGLSMEAQKRAVERKHLKDHTQKNSGEVNGLD